MSRFLFVSAASAMLSLGGIFAQSAPAPSPKPVSDMARFERVAAELRRAGDEKLAAEVMEAARKIAAEKASDKATNKATDKPVASTRAGRRQPSDAGASVVEEVPVLGRLLAPQGAPASPVEVPSLEPLTNLLNIGREPGVARRLLVAPRVVRPVAEASTPPPAPTEATAPLSALRSLMFARPAPAPAAIPEPSAAQPHEYTHRHEVHHYFHGAPPSGSGLGFAGTIAPPTPQPPGQTSAPRGAIRGFAPMDPFSARSPRQARTPAPAPTLASPATPTTPPHSPFGAQDGRRRLLDFATPAPVAPAPAQVRTTRPRSPNPVRAGSVTTPTTEPAYPTPPDAPTARRVRVAPPEDRLENEVDGLRREVEELRELLQKLRTQVKQRKPD